MRPCPWPTRKEPEIAIAFLHVPSTHGRAACLHGAHARMEWWREGRTYTYYCCIDNRLLLLLCMVLWSRATYSTCMTGGTRTHMHACMPRFKYQVGACLTRHACTMHEEEPAVCRTCVPLSSTCATDPLLWYGCDPAPAGHPLLLQLVDPSISHSRSGLFSTYDILIFYRFSLAECRETAVVILVFFE